MAAEALEQSVLESKDKDQLLAIAKALGLKASARTKKSEIIDQILETTGSPSRAGNGDTAGVEGSANGDGTNGDVLVLDLDAPLASTPDAGVPAAIEISPAVIPPVLDDDGEPPAEWELELGGDTAEVAPLRRHPVRPTMPRSPRTRGS